VNKEKADREVRSSGKIVHDRDASPYMMAIQGEKLVLIESLKGADQPKSSGLGPPAAEHFMT
jgi:hypothetical protein